MASTCAASKKTRQAMCGQVVGMGRVVRGGADQQSSRQRAELERVVVVVVVVVVRWCQSPCFETRRRCMFCILSTTTPARPMSRSVLRRPTCLPEAAPGGCALHPGCPSPPLPSPR